MIRIGKVVILNGDTQENMDVDEFKELCPLTCGLSLRSTVTASSINEEGFTYCLQRSISTVDNRELVPQEFNVYWSKKPEDIYPYLAVVTLLLICGTPVKVFNSIIF